MAKLKLKATSWRTRNDRKIKCKTLTNIAFTSFDLLTELSTMYFKFSSKLLLLIFNVGRRLILWFYCFEMHQKGSDQTALTPPCRLRSDFLSFIYREDTSYFKSISFYSNRKVIILLCMCEKSHAMTSWIYFWLCQCS